MSKAWDALIEFDRNHLLDYVAGHHVDELGIMQAIAEQHEDPEVRAAAEDARRALKRAAAFVVRRYEGDIGRELEKRRGEFAVGLLARVLDLWSMHQLVESSAAILHRDRQAMLRSIESSAVGHLMEHGWPQVGLDGTTPRWPAPASGTYLGRGTNFRERFDWWLVDERPMAIAPDGSVSAHWHAQSVLWSRANEQNCDVINLLDRYQEARRAR